MKIKKNYFQKINNMTNQALFLLVGTVQRIIDTHGISQAGNQWQRRTVVVRRDDGFITAVEMWGEAIDPKLKENDKIKCECNVTSKEFNGRWFTTASTRQMIIISTKQPLAATGMPESVANYQQQHPQPQPVLPPYQRSASAPAASLGFAESDNLPFV